MKEAISSFFPFKLPLLTFACKLHDFFSLPYNLGKWQTNERSKFIGKILKIRSRMIYWVWCFPFANPSCYFFFHFRYNSWFHRVCDIAKGIFCIICNFSLSFQYGWTICARLEREKGKTFVMLCENKLQLQHRGGEKL